MSNVSNRHTVLPFIAGESKPLSGQRLAKVGYKQTAAMTQKGEIAPKSICVSVPYFSGEQIRENLESLLPHIGNWLESVQDNVIRGIYEGRKFSLDSVSDAEISVSQCVNFLEAESSGGRLTKEYLESWFAGNMSDGLYVLIASKLGFVSDAEMQGEDSIDVTEDQDIVIQKHLNGYKSLLVGLSGKNISLSTGQINGLRKALEICAPEGDSVAQRLNQKLDVIEKESAQLLVDLL